MLDTLTIKLGKFFLIAVGNVLSAWVHRILISFFIGKTPLGIAILLIALIPAGGVYSLVGIGALIFWLFIFFGIPLTLIILSGKVASKWIKDSSDAKNLNILITILLAILLWIGFYFSLGMICGSTSVFKSTLPVCVGTEIKL